MRPKVKQILPIIVFLLFGQAVAGEITEKYWVEGINPFKNKHIGYETHYTLHVTYHQDQNPSKSIICRVYDVEDKMVLSAEKDSLGYFAYLDFRLEKKYRHHELNVKCE